MKLLPFTAKRSHYDRFNGLVLGRFQDRFDTMGFQSQFSFWYGDNSACPFVTCKKGIGLNKDSHREGILWHRLIATTQLGPILVNNPQLTRWLLDTMGAADAPVAYEEDIQAAYEARMQEFLSPQTKFQL